MKKKILLITAIAAIAVGLFFLIETLAKPKVDYTEYFCGGERNWCTLNGSGVIIETGSNSADDSFTNCYVLKKLKLKKLGKKRPVTLDLLALNMDKFINYAKPQKEILCGGYTEQRELSDEDMATFRKVTFIPLMQVTAVQLYPPSFPVSGMQSAPASPFLS